MDDETCCICLEQFKPNDWKYVRYGCCRDSKIHRKCYIEMIQNGDDRCPVCRQPAPISHLSDILPHQPVHRIPLPNSYWCLLSLLLCIFILLAMLAMLAIIVVISLFRLI